MFYLGDFALLKVKRFFVDFFRDWWGEKIWRWLTNHGIARQGPHLTWKSHFQQQVGWGTRLWNSCRTGPDTGMSHQYNINWAWRQQQLKRVKKVTKWQGDYSKRRRGKGVVSWYPHITIIIINIIIMIIIIVIMSTSSSPSSILLSTVFAQTRRAVIAKLRDKVTRRIFRE